MASAKRQKLASADAGSATATLTGDYKETSLVVESSLETPSEGGGSSKQRASKEAPNNFGVDVDDLTDEEEEESDESEEEDEEEAAGDELDDLNESSKVGCGGGGGGSGDHADIQEQLAAAGPAGVAAAAAIATARKRKRSHTFETNPSVRKRQQTRLIRKLRACLDEYTMRVGQQAVVLITMPGKAVHNFKVFGAQPLESVIRACKQEIMGELEQALLEQAPAQFKEDTSKHELPPLVIDGIPTPVEKMTQAQLRAFIPLMLKYSTGRGKPGWGKDSTRPPWWPETLPWANVRSDARDELEKQRVSWTTTLRQIVTNCYKFHGRDDLLPTFDESEEAMKSEEQQLLQAQQEASNGHSSSRSRQASQRISQQQQQQQNGTTQAVYATSGAYAGNFVHTLAGPDGGTVSLIQVDPANAQILTLPDGTQVRAVRLQTLGPADQLCVATSGVGQQAQLGELQEIQGIDISQLTASGGGGGGGEDGAAAQTITMSEASLGPDGQLIVTGEDGTQSCYPMSSLVSIPASVYQQFAAANTGTNQTLSIMAPDGQTLSGHTLSLHAIAGGHDQPEEAEGEEPQAAAATETQAEQESLQQVADAKEQRPPPDGESGASCQDQASGSHQDQSQEEAAEEELKAEAP